MGPQGVMAMARRGSDLPLRPYQRQALDAVHAAYGRGVRRQLVSLPTGSGKTVLAAHLIKEVGTRTVFVVHRDELVGQTLDKVESVVPALSMGVVKAERDQLGADVIVASAQTLAVGKRLQRLVAALAGQRVLQIEDECHHSPSPTRRRAISEIGADLLVGLTATPMRADRLGLGEVFEESVFHLPMIDLIAAGQLSPLKGVRVETEDDLDAVHTVAGEFNERELAETVDTDARNAQIVRSWQQHAAGRKRTVAFCVNVAHAEHLAEAFREAGVAAAAVLGSTPTEERARLFAEFHAGRLPVLTNCMVLTEGYDEPAIDCVLMARPTKSHGLYVQCVGRGARNAREAGKRDCVVIDFVGNSGRHRLITLPDLAMDGPESESPLAAGADEVRDQRADGEQVDLLETAQAWRKQRERAAYTVNLFGASDFVWRDVDGHYAAPSGDGGWLVLVPQGEGFVPERMARTPRGVERTALFDRPLDAETAMSLAESRITVSALTARAAAWRVGSAQPSDKQLELARKLRIVPTKGATKGQVSDLIDEAMFARVLREALRGAG